MRRVFTRLLRAFHTARPHIWIFFLFLPSIPSVVHGVPNNRPKIGLVLAGGGALGFAHVGVLKVLERERIPVDLVTGTSMGAIVGGAYASGVKLEEMEELLSKTDWNALFNEGAPRKDIPYRFKPGRGREIYGDAKLSFQDGDIVLPSGMVQGQRVLPLLQRMYDLTPSPVEFDRLPLPFRAVAADIETGAPYIPKEGDLSTIVRASMSVPGFFSPVEFDGKVLVDGGISNNLPIDVALELGADALIVVELNADLKKREELTSPLALTGQIVSLLLSQNSNLQHKLLRPQDIMIEPDLKGFGATDFPRGVEIMSRGEAAGELFIEQLKKWSLSESEYEEYQKRRQTNLLPEKQEVLFVRVENSSDISDDALLRKLDVKPGESFSRDKVEAGIEDIYNMGEFSSVKYLTEDLPNGKGIIIQADQKKYLDEYFRFGAAIEDDFDGNDTVRLGLFYRNANVTTTGSYLDVEGEIGKIPRLSTELYQPWGADSRYFVAPSVGISRTNLFVDSDGERIAEYARSGGGGAVAVGRELGASGEARVGFYRGYGDLERRIGDPALSDFSYDLGQTYASIEWDGIDRADFPTSGVLGQLAFLSSLEDLGASDDFNQVSGQYSLPYSFGRSTILFSGDFGITLDDRPIERSFVIGGFLDLSGYTQNSLAASDYGIGRFLYYRRFSEVQTPLFGFDFFAGASYEIATLHNDPDVLEDQSAIHAGSIFLGVDTPILPLYLGVGVADQDETSIYLTFGRIGSRRR